MIKKVSSIGLTLLLVLAFAGSCFAATPSGDLQGFVNAFENGVNPNTLWGSLIAIVPILVTALLFAFVWRRIRKTSSNLANKGKFGM